MAYAGTTIAAGTATAVVVATGRSTEAGRSAHMILDDAPTGGVQARLRTMAAGSTTGIRRGRRRIAPRWFARGRLTDSVSASVALAVAAIPEGLPFVATAAELSASKRLARHNILVRNRRAMEALGRVDIVCFDKTGTLTEGRIQLRAVSDGRGHRPVEAAGTDSAASSPPPCGRAQRRTATRSCPTRPIAPSSRAARTSASASPTRPPVGGWFESCRSSPDAGTTRSSATYPRRR